MMRSHVENVPVATAWLVAEIAEARGRQDLFTRQSPQILKALREMALVQSVESSNRIEGVEVAPERLRPLVLGRAKPADRSEAELQGYREALKLIHADAAKLTVTPALIKRFHKMIQADAGDAGQWKKADNEIVELRSGAAPVVRFEPVTAKDTPTAIEQLCRAYRHTLDQTKVPPLLADALFILDFLCIHPFRDGNGRVSRLLTLLVLYQHGYEVGRYISLERLVEDAKEDYYDVLGRSSQGWHEAKHDWQPWASFYLGIIHRAYRLFEERAGQVKTARGAKRQMVEDAVAAFGGRFTLLDLERACPGVSRDMVRRVLRDLQQAGRATCLGRGPGAEWVKKG
ncbi:MAG: Fic family protein [Pirellulales bacterium]|nr:Fic family protein [Pirellulales bacterium]